MNKELFLSLRLKGAREVATSLGDVQAELAKVSEQLKAQKGVADRGVYNNLLLQQEKLKQESQKLRRELALQVKEMEAAKYPTTSVIGMELAYARLRQQVRGLSEEQRDSVFGQKLIKQAADIKTKILETDNSIKDFKSNIGNYKSALSGVVDNITGGLLTGGIAALGTAAVAFGSASVSAFQEAELAAAKLEQVFVSTGGAVGLSLDEIQKSISDLELTSGIDGDEIADKITAPLLTFKKVQGEVFTEAQKSALDLAKFFGGDFQGAALQLGKALEAPSVGLTALRKSGISFSEQQIEQIKLFEKTGEVAKAQAIILQEVNSQVGGQATAQATELNKLKVAFGNFQELIGEKLLGAFNGLIELVMPLGKEMKRLFDVIFVGTPIAEVLGGVLQTVGVAIGSVFKLVTLSISGFANAGTEIRNYIESNKTLAGVFDFVMKPARAFIDVISNLPIYLSAAGAGIAQFFDNIKNFDFTISATSAFNSELDNGKLRKEAEEKVAAEAEAKRAALLKAQAAKPPGGDDTLTKKDKDKIAKDAKELQERVEAAKKKVRDLSNESILNEFDQQAAKIRAKVEDEKKEVNKNSKGLTKELIDEQIALIEQGGERELKIVEDNRKKAHDAAIKDLKDLQAENFKLRRAAIDEIAQIELEDARRLYDSQVEGVNKAFQTDVKALELRNLNKKDFDAEYTALEDGKNSTLVDLTKEYASETSALAEKAFQEKKATIAAELQEQLRAIREAQDAKKAQVNNDLSAGKVSPEVAAALIAEIDATDKAQAAKDAAKQKEKAAALELLEIKKDANRQLEVSEEDLHKSNLKRIEKEKEERKRGLEAIKDATFEIAQSVSDALFEARAEEIEQEKEQRLQALDEEFNAKKEAAGNNATVIAALEKEYELKKKEEEKKAFEQEKKRQIEQALASAALAIIQSLANTTLPFPFSLAAPLTIGIKTAIEIAKIRRRKLAGGGFAGQGIGSPDETGEIPTGDTIHEGEYVVNKRQVRRHPNVIRFFEATKKLAGGGFASGSLPITDILQGGGGTDSKALAQMIADSVYSGAKDGSQVGTALGQEGSVRRREREELAQQNSTY